MFILVIYLHYYSTSLGFCLKTEKVYKEDKSQERNTDRWESTRQKWDSIQQPDRHTSVSCITFYGAFCWSHSKSVNKRYADIYKEPFPEQKKVEKLEYYLLFWKTKEVGNEGNTGRSWSLGPE